MKTRINIFLAAAMFCSTTAWAQTTVTSTTAKLPADYQGYSLSTDQNRTKVSTQYGDVAGYIENGIYNYKGIPYAQAGRYEEPRAPQAWQGVRSSRAYGPSCPQEFRSTWLMDAVAYASDWDDGYPGEDCLRVNIWTPGINDGKKRAVLFWIHGGGFSTGSGQEQPAYDGASLAKKGDVVVVSINHRLNALGFLNLSQYGSQFKHSANLGMMDIVEALKWAHKNVANFGGDPENITIFGQSGGGRKVSTLLCMPAAKGLFKKAIVESGSGATFMRDNYSKRIGELTVQNLGLTAATIDKIKTVPYKDLLAAATKAINEVRKEADAKGEGSIPSIWGFMPTKDGDLLPEDAFKNGSELQSKDIPMIVGTTMNEFAGFSALQPGFFQLSKEDILAKVRQAYGNKADAYVKAFEKAYPGMDYHYLLLVDFKYRPQALQQIRTKAADKGAPVYNYLFKFQSPSVDGMLTASHCQELPYVFNNVTRCASSTGATSEAIKLGDMMSSAWLNFAKTGNPNGAGVPQWDAFTTQRENTMIFNAPTSEERVAFDAELMKVALSK